MEVPIIKPLTDTTVEKNALVGTLEAVSMVSEKIFVLIKGADETKKQIFINDTLRVEEIELRVVLGTLIGAWFFAMVIDDTLRSRALLLRLDATLPKSKDILERLENAREWVATHPDGFGRDI